MLLMPVPPPEYISKKLGNPLTGAVEGHRQPLHAIVGGDEHGGEVTGRRHAGDGDLLPPQSGLDALLDGFLIAHLVQCFDILPQLRAAAIGGIDRAGDFPTVGAGSRAKGDHKVVQVHYRAPGRLAHDVAAAIDLPILAGSDEHDVLLLGVYEDVPNMLQPAQQDKFARQRLAGLDFSGQCRVESAE